MLQYFSSFQIALFCQLVEEVDYRFREPNVNLLLVIVTFAELLSAPSLFDFLDDEFLFGATKLRFIEVQKQRCVITDRELLIRYGFMVLFQPLPSALTAFGAVFFVFEPLEITVTCLVPKPLLAKAFDIVCFLCDVDIPEIEQGDEMISASEVH